jgi:hypothetical protein
MSVLDLIPQKKKKAQKRAVIPKIEVPRYQPPLQPSQNPVPTRLLKKLKALGSKYRNVNLTEKIAQVIAMAVMLVTLQMFLDWLINLNLFFRVLLLAGDIVLLALFFRKRLLPLIKRPPNVEACALMVEKKWPRHRGKLIATVQFANPSFGNNSRELMQSIQQETDAATGALDFNSIVSTKLVKRRALIAFSVIAIFGGWMFITAPGSISLLERVFLIPAKVPRKTDIICLSGNKIIPAGESVLLEAQATGIIPSHGRVTMTDDSGKIQEITIDPEPDNTDRFSLKIDRVSQSFSYVIRLNDAVSDTYQIKAIPRPNVTSIACEQVYPAYTGLPNVKRTVGNLALLAGSKLNIHAETNSKIEKATLTLIGLNKTIPLNVDGLDGNQLIGSIDIPPTSLTGFSIQLTNQAGIVSGDETQYGIDLIPDHPPTVQLIYPEKLQELYTLKAKPTIAFVAGDDYGLAKVTLCYRILLSSDAPTDAAATATPPNRIEMDLGNDRPKDMKNRYLWDLATIQPPVTEGNTIEYWMEAQDANNVTGPGITDSEHHTIKIVSEVEKKAEVMNRLMDSLSTITDISQNQEKVNEDLGTIIQGKDDKK